MHSQLITGGTVYSASAAVGVVENGAVLIEGGRVARVGPSEEVRAATPVGAEVIDARGGLILPGFVNAHWHDFYATAGRAFTADKRASRLDDRARPPGLLAHGGSIEAMSASFDRTGRLGARFTADEALAISRYAVWCQLRAGTTTVGELGSVNSPLALAQAAHQMGTRAVVTPWISDGFCDVLTGRYQTTVEVDTLVDRVLRLFADVDALGSARVRAMPSLIYIANGTDLLLRRLAELAVQRDAPLSMHVGAQRNEPAAMLRYFGRSAVERLRDTGALSDRLIAVHCSHIDADERQLLLAAGVHFDHSPASYGEFGESVVSARGIGELIRLGASVAVSTDAEVTPGGGMIAAMRHAWLGHNEVWSDDALVRPSDALRMATAAGAAAIGWSDVVGTLEPGKAADIVIARIGDWRGYAAPRPLEALLRSGSSADVDTVMVEGQVLLREGRGVVADEDELRAEYWAAVRSVSSRVFNTEVPKEPPHWG